MEAKRAQLKDHASVIAGVLRDVCDASNAGPLVQEYDESGNIVIVITHSNNPLSRLVTTDLGLREPALRLPMPDDHQRRYWIGLHERWEWKSARRTRLHELGG